MRFRILGPVSVSPRTPSAAKPRALLATLLVRAGEVISASSLIDELWGTEPPRTATTTLQVYVSQLRKLLAEAESPQQASEGLLLTRSPGYLLRVPEGDFDLARFEALNAAGRGFYEKGEYANASELLHDALEVWTGPALSGVPHGVRLESSAIRLDELRMETLEQRIMADLRLGRHKSLAGELMALATEHPLRESLHGHLMVVLYRTGRQSDALRVYGRLRRSLVEDLGVEPGRGVRRLQERILRSDPSLDWKPLAPGGSAVAPSTVPLRELPAGAAGFVGRHEVTAAAERMLRGEAGEHPVQLLTVAGHAGVGKTALATHLTRQVADAFPDGQVMLRLRGALDRHLTTEEAAAALLRLLGAQEDQSPAGPLPADRGRLTASLREAVRGRRLLLVFDDAGSESQVRPLLSAVGDCSVIITSRRTLSALDGARHLVLEPLLPDEAMEMLHANGGKPMAADPVATAEIAGLCGYLPLALRVASALLVARPHTTAAGLAARLRDERTRLQRLHEGDLDLRACLMTVYLEARPEQQRAFRLLGLSPAPDFALWTAAALLGVSLPVAEELVEGLVRAQLLEARPQPEGRQVRYGFHELLRVLSVQLRQEESEESLQEATKRLCGAFLTLSRRADALLAPGRIPRTGEMSPELSAYVEDPALDRYSSLAWFREEAAGLVASVRLAHEAGLGAFVWELASSAAGYFHTCAAWEEWEETHRRALDAARRAGSPTASAAVLRSLGDLAWQRSEADLALGRYDEARRLFSLVGDQLGAARCTIGEADVLLGQGHLPTAARRYGRALAICSAGHDLRGVVAALNGLAMVDLSQGLVEDALRQLAECGRTAQLLGDHRWAEYARRAAARITAAQDRGAAVEVGPGMWLLAPSRLSFAPAAAEHAVGVPAQRLPQRL
ncbi:AfsR/SARP family transcriptional regulator [Streptomyces sp. SID9727]|uniref:AfsR/SARP family transcriptional regulator n=1 Tax=Streptomyces sp. SID9727 TaxID=2706114 RepID=UPI0013C74BDC|nr:AfsR/SARP family transcriptional regulator [Streptomyces sp. SID9727]NEC66344.1 transcriptional regulator [Streptomyces sp. SID9727]